jgi:ABC-2 type transport system permease protein
MTAPPIMPLPREGKPDPGLVARVRMLSGSQAAVAEGFTPSGGRIVPPPKTRGPRSSAASVLHLVSPKWMTARARQRTQVDGRTVRWIFLSLIGLCFWGFSFGALYRVLNYFRGVAEIGPLLAGKLLGVLLLSFALILLLSNVISALSSFFLARDLDMLVASPVDWLTLYGSRLLETALHSSWMVVLLAVPMLTAYGVVYDGGFGFIGIALAGFIPFLIIPSVIGSALTLVLVNVFPARRTRDILSVITVLAGAGVVVFLRLMRPEQLARPEGFRSLVEFIGVLRGPTSPMLPSEWLQDTLMGWLTRGFDPLSLYLLWTTAAALVVLGAGLHRALYAKGFTKAQEGGQLSGKTATEGPRHSWLPRALGTRRRELVLKEIRLFFRDTTQWSQLILLGVLVIVYVVNIKFLPLTGEGITFFVVNLIPFLNLALAGFVLASIAARFLFPGVSLEGRSWWLVRSSPLDMHDLLWAKFWVGTVPLLVLALGIITVTNTLLQVSAFMFAVSVFTISLMTFALAGLAVGFGALYPRFESENAAQIPTSFGGLMFMMTAVCLIGVVITLEARPVYSYLSARTFETEVDAGEMILGFALAALVCLAATFVPLRLACRRLERLER